MPHTFVPAALDVTRSHHSSLGGWPRPGAEQGRRISHEYNNVGTRVSHRDVASPLPTVASRSIDPAARATSAASETSALSRPA